MRWVWLLLLSGCFPGNDSVTRARLNARVNVCFQGVLTNVRAEDGAGLINSNPEEYSWPPCGGDE